MNFKQLLKSQNFHLMSACISHRFYDNGVYQIKMVNITGTCYLIRNGNILIMYIKCIKILLKQC